MALCETLKVMCHFNPSPCTSPTSQRTYFEIGPIIEDNTLRDGGIIINARCDLITDSAEDVVCDGYFRYRSRSCSTASSSTQSATSSKETSPTRVPPPSRRHSRSSSTMTASMTIYSVPIDRFWSADRQELESSPEGCAGLLVQIYLKMVGDGHDDLGFNGRGLKVEEEIVGRRVTARVLKATLCWPDSGEPKNGFIDVL